MTEVNQVHKLLDDAGIEHIEMNGVFLCKGANDYVVRISNYEDDDSRFQAKFEGLTPSQAVRALRATLAEEE